LTGRGLSVFAATEGVNRRPGTADDFEICIILRTLHFASGISARSAYVGNSTVGRAYRFVRLRDFDVHRSHIQITDIFFYSVKQSYA